MLYAQKYNFIWGYNKRKGLPSGNQILINSIVTSFAVVRSTWQIIW